MQNNPFDVPLNANKLHEESRNGWQPYTPPARDIIVTCKQPNGYTVALRCYSDAAAIQAEAELHGRGAISRCRRAQSAYWDI